VTQTDNPASATQPLSTTARLLWIILIVATLYLCYFQNLGAIGFLGPDEPRYAWIARDMVESGDWVTPRLYGQPWFEKPVLYYWGAALSFKLFGVNEAAARLPGAISALLATLAMAWLAWRVYGAETARWLLLLLPTTVGMIGFSHAAATDMPFAGMLSIAMVFAATLLGLTRNPYLPIVPGTPWRGLISFGLFLGLAVLAKGPAAIVLAGGAVLLWAAFTKRWRDVLWLLHPAAILSFCVTTLPWYVICSRRNPDFFRIFIVEHNFKRYLTPEFQHVQPFWYYIPILLIAFAPWTFALLWSAAYGALRVLPARRPSAATLLLFCWSAFCIVFFSISKSKLPGYILPAIPAIGLLLTRSCVALSAEGKKAFRWIRFAFSFLGLPGAIALSLIAHYYGVSPSASEKMTSAATVLFLWGLANLLLVNRVSPYDRLRATAPLCVLPVLVLVGGFKSIATPWLTPDPSGKSLAMELEKLQSLPQFSEFYVSSMNRGQQFGLSFYLHREISTWEPESPKSGILLVHSKSCADLLVKESWQCSRNAFDLGSTGWFAYRVTRRNALSQ
jgi:4-amino-4-deoxy-L-arabinose transferase-like glycosyltransferase